MDVIAVSFKQNFWSKFVIISGVFAWIRKSFGHSSWKWIESCLLIFEHTCGMFNPITSRCNIFKKILKLFEPISNIYE